MNPDDYFHCEFYTCTMRAEICVIRQQGVADDWNFTGGAFGYSFEGCKECEQGKKVAKGKYKRVAMPTFKGK